MIGARASRVRHRQPYAENLNPERLSTDTGCVGVEKRISDNAHSYLLGCGRSLCPSRPSRLPLVLLGHDPLAASPPDRGVCSGQRTSY